MAPPIGSLQITANLFVALAGENHERVDGFIHRFRQIEKIDLPTIFWFF